MKTPVADDIKPPLKWAGGKRWLIPHLKRYWEKHNWKRLVEPFCGGLAVVLGLLPQKALLNDINPHAINFYHGLKKGLRHEYEMTNDKEIYYRHRARFNALIATGKADSKEASLLFYYLNRTGYNGLCRFNRKGGFNVPFGRYESINYINDFTHYKKIFAGWEFISGDFEIIKVEPDDFIYADPPYDVEFTQYAKEGFNWQDQVRLAKWLSKHEGPVVLSNQATDRIIKLYTDLGFDLQYVHAPRMISCTGNRSKAKEILALKGL